MRLGFPQPCFWIVYKEKGLLYAPGVATMTFEISGENLKKMIDKLPNKKYVYDSEHVEE